MATRSAPSTAIVVIAIELVAVGGLTLLAGISDQMGNVMLFIIVGAWLLFGITQTNTMTDLLGAFNALRTNPSNNPSLNTGAYGDMYVPGY